MKLVYPDELKAESFFMDSETENESNDLEWIFEYHPSQFQGLCLKKAPEKCLKICHIIFEIR